MDEERSRSSLGRAVGLFLAGGVIGAGLALLYAPDSGEKTRQKVKEGADKALQKVKDLQKNWLDKIDDIVKDVTSKASQLVESGKNLADEKKKELLAAIDAGKKALEEERKKIEEKKATLQ
jgi:gas vesicle protein